MARDKINFIILWSLKPKRNRETHMKIEWVKSFSMHMFRKIIIILPYSFYKIEVSTYKKLKIKKKETDRFSNLEILT